MYTSYLFIRFNKFSKMQLLFVSSLSLLFLLINIPISLLSSSSPDSTPNASAPETSGVLATMPEEVAAMEALKESLRVPDRFAWKGDPCTPSSWGGVTCRPNPLGLGLVIYKIDLANQGLKGYISARISLLKNLNSLNLSSNCLSGEIPNLGNTSLVKLDLSDNHLNGSIPQHLSSSRLELLFLQNNHLRGWFPLELYSNIVLSGVDVSGNEGLCSYAAGIPNLQKCSIWTIALYNNFFAAFILIMSYMLVILLTSPMYQYHPHNPNLVFYGKFRVGLAGLIAFFHFPRIILLYATAGVRVYDSYATMRFTVLMQMFAFFSFVSIIVGALRHRWGQTRNFHMVAILGFYLFSAKLSAAAFIVIYSRPWLRNLEKFWPIINCCVFFSFVLMRDSFDLRAYLVVKIIRPLREALRSMGWMHYAMLSFAIWLTVDTLDMAY